MTGRPDSTDPLDRIEEAAKVAGGYDEWLRLEPEDVLALVAVARAARGVMTQMDYETPHHTRLREALARLDGAR